MSGQDRGGWAHSYRTQGLLLRRFFLRRGAAGEDAEDCVQEVYLRLLRNEQTNGGTIDNPEAYLYTVAANLIRERYGERKAMPALEDIDLLVETLRSEHDVEGSAEQAQRWRSIRAALARLPTTTRLVMELHYQSGLSCERIGERLDISVHMVRKHIGRGLERCRKTLAVDNR